MRETERIREEGRKGRERGGGGVGEKNEGGPELDSIPFGGGPNYMNGILYS